MSEEKISIELTKEQLLNLNKVLSIGVEEHQNSDLVRKSFPKEFQSKPSYTFNDKTTVEDLIVMGSIADRGSWKI